MGIRIRLIASQYQLLTLAVRQNQKVVAGKKR